ncbi:chorismate-binding protein [Micromonospora sp. BRA006-A]|uniref:chorismate-binding protein n=1 Tax=Micromonospora sp. BRA006-A TaxID=2962860 RepID=UPI00296F1E41|nr:chorismate-binding protein [Micromonospora sp. BRA006-A]MDW3848131.1 chorismate-binding protein [Micromonospora sp. BRA006-A]
MTRNGPDVVEALPQVEVDAPGAPPGCRRRIVETARLYWRIGDGGDPADLAQRFLAAHGIDRDDLTRPGRHDPDAAVCGAALYLSAAAGAYAIGVSPGAPSPAPALPDLVVVVYHHTGRPAAPRPPAPEPWRLGDWRDSWTPAAHADAVGAVRAAIARGDVYQVNIVGHAAAGYTGDPRTALARLAALPGARYGGTLHGPGWALGCASPETLIAVEHGRLVTRPIKGTRPATAAGRRDLLASAKERAEHVMIVDLERNDLARIARTGSVRVDELFAVRRWCDLWQAESTVSAAPADGLGLADLLRAVCPGGSVTGAPKHAALAHIGALEPVGRGASMGALGWVGPDRLDLGLTIRTAAADGNLLHLWAGGGITWDSDPAAEVAEAAAKAAPIRALLAG